MVKAAEYARYSTDMQSENSSLYQYTKIREYCHEHNIQIVASYTDEAKSGTNTGRDGFQNMLAAARRKEFDTVVIYYITRGSRDVADWFSFRKEMRFLKVSVISVKNNLGDPLNPNDFLIELMNVGLGQHLVLSTRQKSIDSVAVKVKLVRLIFNMYAKDKSYDAIVKALSGYTRKERPFGKNSLKSILENDRYIGTYTWNRKIYKQMRKWAVGVSNPKKVSIEDAIPAIIDDTTWCICQRRLNSRDLNAKNRAKRDYLLSSLIKCDSCGCSYSGGTSVNQRGYENKYYTCSNKRRTKTCNSPNISASLIEPFITDSLKEFLSSVSISNVVDFILDSYKASMPKLSDNQKEVLDIQTKISNGMKAILSGLDFPDLRDELFRLQERKKELELSITTAMSGKIMDRSKLTKYVSDCLNGWESMNDKELIQNYVLGITILPNGDFTVKVGVVHTKSSERGI